MHKFNISDRFYKRMRKSEQSIKTSWNIFVNKVEDLLSPKQSEKAILDISVVRRIQSEKKIILKSWKKFSRELKNETINVDVRHGKMLELEIGFKGLLDNIPEKDA